LIEDDDELAARIIAGLTPAGYTTEWTNSGLDGYTLGTDQDFDAVILDLGLPEMRGLDVLRKWRAEGRNFPVLVLTARGSWPEKVDGLNAGADDYLTKPFHTPEVIARLRALIRRTSGVAGPVLSHRDISLDINAGRVMLKGLAVEMTALEIRMLNYFLHRIGRLIPQAELVEHLYSLEDSRESNTIEVYVSRLRKKLGADVIKTVRGQGYRME